MCVTASLFASGLAVNVCIQYHRQLVLRITVHLSWWQLVSTVMNLIAPLRHESDVKCLSSSVQLASAVCAKLAL